jgi:hypothetical protein
MFCGLILMAAGALMLVRQCDPTLAQQPPEQNKEQKTDNKTGEKDAAEKKDDKTKWRELFDGKTLKGWKIPEFGGEGKVYVRDGAIVMEMGGMMTGVTWTGKVLRDNFELVLEGMRLDGSDFFCTTTFPVGDEYCSLVMGGWGGSLVGLSNVDGADASENLTMQSVDFKERTWYKVRIRVTAAAVEAWIDGKRIVNQPRKDHAFGIRPEVDLCRPLGISTWSTKGAVRNIRLRAVEPEKQQTADKK